MKKFIAFLCVGVCSFALFGCNQDGDGSKSPAQTVKNYDIEYGTTYTVPYFDGCTYSLKNSKGEDVELLQNDFYVDDKAGYTLNITGDVNLQYVYRVVDKTAPEIRSSFAYKYVKADEASIALPSVTCKDAYDGEIQPSYKVFYDGGEVAVENGSFANQGVGVYELSVTAKDAAGNEAKEVISYNVTNDVSSLKVIGAFDTPYGVEHIGNARGLTASYSEDFAYAGESGSTKLYVNGDQYFVPAFILHNLGDADMSDSAGFSFSVYNDLDIEASFTVNWIKNYVLPSKQWTTVSFTKEKYDELMNDEWFIENSNLIYGAEGRTDISNIDGMYLAFFTQDGTGLKKGNFYISNMYEIPKYTATQFDAEITALKALPEEDLSLDIVKKHMDIYSFMDLGEQGKVTTYGALQKMYKEYLFKGVTIVEDKLFYFDEEVGARQVSTGKNNDYGNPCSVAYTTEKAYGTEKGSLKFTNLASWNAHLQFTSPYGDTTAYSSIYFYVYVDSSIPLAYTILDGHGYSSADQTDAVAIPSNEWVRIEMPLTSGLGSLSEIYFHDVTWNNTVPATATIYFSAVYGVKA